MAYNPNRLINEYVRKWDGMQWNDPKFVRQVPIKTLLEEMSVPPIYYAGGGMFVHIPADEDINNVS